MTDEEWALLGRKALIQIQLCLTKRVAFNIFKEKTTSGIMSTLANYYKKQFTSNRLFLLRSFVKPGPLAHRVLCQFSDDLNQGQILKFYLIYLLTFILFSSDRCHVCFWMMPETIGSSLPGVGTTRRNPTLTFE